MEEDSFVESVESLIKSVKDLIVQPVKRLTGFASLGLLLVVLLITAVIFLFSGISGMDGRLFYIIYIVINRIGLRKPPVSPDMFNLPKILFVIREYIYCLR